MLLDSYARRRPQRHGRPPAPRRRRAQPADAAAGARVVSAGTPRSPTRWSTAPVVVVGMMRSGTTLVQRLLAADPRFHCAHGWEVVEVAPAARPRLVGRRTRGSPRPRRARSSRGSGCPTSTRSTRCTRSRPRRRSSSSPTRSCSHVPESGAHVPAYRAWIDTPGLRAGVRPPPPDAPAAAVAEAAARRDGRTGGCSRRRPTSATSTTCAARFPDLHVVHLHRDPVDTIPSGASLNATLHAMHADTVDLHRVGAEWIERMGWTNDRALATRAAWGDGPGPGHRPRLRGRRAPTRSARSRGCTTRSGST